MTATSAISNTIKTIFFIFGPSYLIPDSIKIIFQCPDSLDSKPNAIVIYYGIDCND